MNENTFALLRMLAKSGRLTEARLDSLLSSLDLSATRLFTLQQLARASEPVSPGGLAECMAFAKSNATQLVDSLEANHLVRRVPDPDDRRCTHLALTAEGHERSQAALEALRPLAEKIEALFSPEELALLAGLLQRMNDAVRSA